ncbi:hypothetical protein HNP86_000954 [Methanococcus maripaludis]|uniref:Uncharacterized protein n=1 Tax=Methanococcus maripaludis TaxID=39152 RepID=A0A7J9NV10_METMI|nr:hypothetical protein [Methanococcus maripaludis]MBA2850823.1 hypothetical protein [Methanococcus maripaludis]
MGNGMYIASVDKIVPYAFRTVQYRGVLNCSRSLFKFFKKISKTTCLDHFKI